MSYSCTIIDIQTNEELYWSNITFNVYNIFAELMYQLEEKNLYEAKQHKWYDELMTCQYPLTFIQTLITELENNKNYYSQWNAENGWGTVDTVIQWLTNLKIAIMQTISKKVIYDIIIEK